MIIDALDLIVNDIKKQSPGEEDRIDDYMNHLRGIFLSADSDKEEYKIKEISKDDKRRL